LNDPELQRLEQELRGVAFSPAADHRERLMYACGHAAGRAEMKRRLRAMSAALVALVVASVGLSLQLLKEKPSEVAGDSSEQAPFVADQPTTPPINTTPRKQQEFGNPRGPQLSAATSLEQMLEIDRVRSTERLATVNVDSPSPRVLSVSSRSWLDESWE
jgi:hypothetical protein